MKKRILLVIDPRAQIVIDNLERSALRSKRIAVLVRSISTKLALLKDNPVAGTKIPQRLIPKRFNCDNLWKIDLADFWRMLYTLKSNEVEIKEIVLDVMDHPDYDKKFGYGKN